MPPRLVQRKALKRSSSGPASGCLANPATSPCSLIAVAVAQWGAPRLPISITSPLSQSAATRAECLPTAWSHLPEMPTTCPLLLIATAALVVSPGSGSSCSISISSSSSSFFRFQMTATNWKTCGALHPCGSRTEVSAHPTTCLRLLPPAPTIGGKAVVPTQRGQLLHYSVSVF